MKISELIVELVELMAQHGDVECECRNVAGDTDTVGDVSVYPRRVWTSKICHY